MSTLSRRDILRSGSALIIGFTIAPAARRAAAQTGEAAKSLGKSVDITEVDSFLAIHPNGSATVFTGKVDLGTGLRIAVRQMAAEELGLPIEKVELVEGDTLLTPSLETGILAGETRAALLELARGEGRDVDEGIYPLERLLEADEVFTSSSVREVMPVVSMDGHALERGPAAAELQDALRREARR